MDKKESVKEWAARQVRAMLERCMSQAEFEAKDKLREVEAAKRRLGLRR